MHDIVQSVGSFTLVVEFDEPSLVLGQLSARGNLVYLTLKQRYLTILTSL